jgi:hypothetical protein
LLSPADLSVLGGAGGEAEHQHQCAQKPLEPSQQQVEVEAGGGEHGVDAVAFAALEVIAVHAVLGLEVTDHRLDRAARRFISRRMVLVTRRTWPEIQTLKRLG